MHRRRLLTALAGLAGLALAPATGRAAARRIPLADVFPMLDQYLALPPAARDRFSIAYLAFRDKKPAPDARAAVIGADAARRPLVADAAGALGPLPTLAELKGKTWFEFDGAPFQFSLELRAALAPSSRIAVADLTAALTQVNAAIARFADGETVARLTAIYFPDAGDGAAALASGATQPLQVFTFQTLGRTAYFEPGKAPTATAVTLARAPSRIILAGRPKPA
jgi:hypothetical protein